MICVDYHAMIARDASDGTTRGRARGDTRTMATRWMDGWFAGHGAARMLTAEASIDAVDARCRWVARTMLGILCVSRRSITRYGD